MLTGWTAFEQRNVAALRQRDDDRLCSALRGVVQLQPGTESRRFDPARWDPSSGRTPRLFQGLRPKGVVLQTFGVAVESLLTRNRSSVLDRAGGAEDVALEDPSRCSVTRPGETVARSMCKRSLVYVAAGP